MKRILLLFFRTLLFSFAIFLFVGLTVSFFEYDGTCSPQGWSSDRYQCAFSIYWVREVPAYLFLVAFLGAPIFLIIFLILFAVLYYQEKKYDGHVNS